MSERYDPIADREADRQARLAAQTVFDRPVVLEAGAGTGKTAALVARIVAWTLGRGWQLAEAEEAEALDREGRRGEPQPERVAARCLDRVVAITFTDAAAAEMATRVGEAFAAVARGELPPWLAPAALPSDPEVKSKRAAALLVAMDHLTVSTIHAFCRRLLSRWPLEGGLHPSFTVDADEHVLERVVQESVEAAIRRAFVTADDPDLGFLVGRGIGPQSLAEAVMALARAGVPAETLGADVQLGARTAALARRLAEAVAGLAGLVAPRLAGVKKAKNAAALAVALLALAKRLEHAEAIGPDALAGVVAELLDESLVGHLKKWRKGELNNEERARLGEVRGELRAGSASLVGLIEFLGTLDMELLAHAQRALAPLLTTVHRELRRRGAETFAALLCDARDLLARHPAAAARERHEIRQLLVDEFQDTDALQCEMLRTIALAGPIESRPCLFLVGDPKQSIYGWRSADLAAYEGFLADLDAARGERHTLSVNFRSVPVVLDEVARCVAPVMVREAGVQPEFRSLVASEAKATSPGFSSERQAPVEFWVSWASPDSDGEGGGETNSGEAAELEARALANDIRAVHDESNVAWREIGVLLRTFSDADTYLQAMRDAGVPYAVERDRSYYRRREVIEAAALVRTILDPADHLALVTWLRSCTVGVPDAGLLPLWDGGFPGLMTELTGPDDPRLARLRELVGSVAGALPADVPGIERIGGWEHALAAGIEAVAELRGAFEQNTAPAFVERLRTLTLIEAGEATRALGAYRVANLDRFFRELTAAIEESGRDREAVLRTLRIAIGERREAEEGRPREAAQDAVQVMTIHKAKGLDFAHVYLLQTHKRSGRGRSTVADAEEIDGGFEFCLFGAPTPGWIRVEEHRAAVAEAELVRTLYVALTRAKDRVVVAGRWPSSTERRPPSDSHIALLRHRAGDLDLRALQAQATEAGRGFIDAMDARWVFLSTAGERRQCGDRIADTSLPSPIEAEADRLLLVEHRSAAVARMARPTSAPASAEAHRELRELLAEQHAEERPAVSQAIESAPQGVAVAAGSLVHLALERIDLRADLAGEVARQRERLRSLVGGRGRPADAEPAARAGAMLGQLATSRLGARLATIAPHVVARELAVLLPPGDGPAAPVGFVAGAIDVVYRDPSTGELVIADYKTDDVSGEAEIAVRAATYASQGVIYQRALKEALGLATAPRFELWFLRADRIVSLPG